jgi:hypothetical protein
MCCFPLCVRIRITRHCRDEIDGVSLDHFEVGLTYNVDPSLASYLVAIGCAEPLDFASAERSSEDEQALRVNVRRWKQVAADLSGRKKRDKK